MSPACEKCSPFGGAWMRTDEGMRRCDCARGRELATKPVAMPPVLSTEAATVFMELLACIPFFPSEVAARMMIAEEIAAMCADEDQAKWLCKRMIRLYSRWPGLPEMRLAFCSRYWPLDALLPSIESDVYPDGIPSELDPPPQENRYLPAPGGMISAAPSIAATVQDLAIAKDLKRIGSAGYRVREIPVRRMTDANRITGVDIKLAVEKHREAKAEEELHGSTTGM